MPDERQSRTQTPGRWNDAKVYGNLLSDEVQTALSRRFPILWTEDYNLWFRQELLLSEIVERHLSRHVERDYDMSVPYSSGAALLFAETRHARNGDRHYRVLNWRTRKLASLDAVGIQIYGHLSFTSVVERLRACGYFAIAYTMHMHGMTHTDIQWPKDRPVPDREGVEELARERGLKNVSGFRVLWDEIFETYIEIRHEPVERCRIILPLTNPFPLKPESYPEHVKCWSAWSDKVADFARESLGLNLDPAWCRPDLAFPLPGHLPNADWGLVLVAGPALSLEGMPEVG